MLKLEENLKIDIEEYVNKMRAHLGPDLIDVIMLPNVGFEMHKGVKKLTGVIYKVNPKMPSNKIADFLLPLYQFRGIYEMKNKNALNDQTMKKWKDYVHTLNVDSSNEDSLTAQNFTEISTKYNLNVIRDFWSKTKQTHINDVKLPKKTETYCDIPCVDLGIDNMSIAGLYENSVNSADKKIIVSGGKMTVWNDIYSWMKKESCIIQELSYHSEDENNHLLDYLMKLQSFNHIKILRQILQILDQNNKKNVNATDAYIEGECFTHQLFYNTIKEKNNCCWITQGCYDTSICAPNIKDGWYSYHFLGNKGNFHTIDFNENLMIRYIPISTGCNVISYSDMGKMNENEIKFLYNNETNIKWGGLSNISNFYIHIYNDSLSFLKKMKDYCTEFFPTYKYGEYESKLLCCGELDTSSITIENILYLTYLQEDTFIVTIPHISHIFDQLRIFWNRYCKDSVEKKCFITDGHILTIRLIFLRICYSQI
ncbi:MAG: hypothetical protein EOP34_02735 [Rickettsiales bacterium]|nr:MAG: hypothetical protein EOP34_02735 [Rickettsiales bacterium]